MSLADIRQGLAARQEIVEQVEGERARLAVEGIALALATELPEAAYVGIATDLVLDKVGQRPLHYYDRDTVRLMLAPSREGRLNFLLADLYAVLDPGNFGAWREFVDTSWSPGDGARVLDLERVRMAAAGL